MAENLCPQCGAPLPAGATQCKYCGETISVPQFPQPQQTAYQQPQQTYYQQPQQTTYQQPQQTSYQQPTYGYGQPKQNTYQQPAYSQPVPYTADVINPSWPVKSKIAAGLLAIFLGGIGIHKFYLGKISLGIVYLVFCWTGIPAIIGFIEGIVYLCSSDHNFQVKNQVRLE